MTISEKVGIILLLILIVYLAFDFRKFLKTDNRWDDFM